MEDNLRTRILTYLESHRGMVFSSAVDGQQFASTTCYVADTDLTIYGFVFKNSDKFQAVQTGSPIALVIDDGFQIPMKGVEFIGQARFVEGPGEQEHAQKLLAAKFPKLNNVWGHPAVVLIRILPDKITLIDWSVRLGHSETLTFEGATPWRRAAVSHPPRD